MIKMEEKENTLENEKEFADYTLKRLSKKVDDVILTTSNVNKMQIKFVNNKISNITNWDATSIDVFAAHKKSLVTTTIKSLNKKDIDKSIENLMVFMKNTKPNKDYKGIAKGPFKYIEIEESYDKKFLNMGERGIDFVEQGINKALQMGAKRVSGVLETTASHVNIKTSNDVEADEKGTQLYYSVRSLVDKNASGHWTSCSRMLSKFDPDAAAEKSADIAKISVSPKQGPTGKYDVLFAPMPFANVIEHIGNAASVFNVESGLSCLAGKIGKKIGNEKVTIIDDGRLKNGFHSSMFDAEGFPTQRNVIADKGVLKTYLHNTSTAKKYKTKSTGNAGLITPSPHNLVFSGGKHDFNEMIKGVKKGLYVTNVWYTRFQNYSTGDFSTIPRDGCFLIENGRITQPVRGIRITDNLLNIMKLVDKVGSDSHQVFCWELDTPVTTPHVLVKSLNITRPSSE